MCFKACGDFMNHKKHIDVCLSNNFEQVRLDYRVRLIASYDCLKYLLRLGLTFRGIMTTRLLLSSKVINKNKMNALNDA